MIQIGVNTYPISRKTVKYVVSVQRHSIRQFGRRSDAIRFKRQAERVCPGQIEMFALPKKARQ